MKVSPSSTYGEWKERPIDQSERLEFTGYESVMRDVSRVSAIGGENISTVLDAESQRNE